MILNGLGEITATNSIAPGEWDWLYRTGSVVDQMDPTNPAASPVVPDMFDPSMLREIKDGVFSITQSILAAKQASDLNEINMERLRRGLSPISAADMAPRVNVGLPAETEGLLKILLIGGVAVLAIAALKR